jgi:hypothetical protein
VGRDVVGVGDLSQRLSCCDAVPQHGRYLIKDLGEVAKMVLTGFCRRSGFFMA